MCHNFKVCNEKNVFIVFALDFQNFLRTQTGNTTTVNIIISTVDYLLRLQVDNQFWSCLAILLISSY